MKTLFLLLAAGLLLLTGCPKERSEAKPAAPLGSSDALSVVVDTAADAAQAADLAQADRLAKLSANVNAAADAVDADEKPVAQGELTVAKGRLSDVQPDSTEIAAAAERRALVEAGRAEEARAAYATAAKEGQQAAARIRELEAQATTLAQERDAAVKSFAEQAEKNRTDNQKKIDAALAAQRDGVLKSQVSWLNRIGFGCLAAAALAVGLGIGFGGLAVVRRVVPLAVGLAVIGLFAFGAAQILGAWWFLPAVGTAGGVAALWFGIWAWRHYKREDLAQELAARASKVAAVAQTAVPVLDAAYDQAEAPVKAWLDTHVFDRLSSLMDREEKATVHAIRAGEGAS